MSRLFSLRIDLDTRIGVREGLPKILEVLRKTDSTATFFLVLGSEPFLPSVLYKKFLAREKYVPWYEPLERPKMRKTAYGEFARRLFFPKNFSEENAQLLRDAAEDHEFGCHAVEHERWALSLPRLDLQKEFSEMVSRYEKIFGKKPSSFAAPVFRTNLKVLEKLDEFGFSAAGDLPGVEPFHPVVEGRKFSHVQVPVNLLCSDTVPLIEDYAARGLSDEKIVGKLCGAISEKHSKGLPAVLYGHGLFEGRLKANVLERVLAFVKSEGMRVLSMQELAGHYSRNYVEVPLEVVNR